MGWTRCLLAQGPMFGCSSVWSWPHDACKHRLLSASYEIVTVTECNRGHAAEKLLKAAANFGAGSSNRGGRKAQALFALSYKNRISAQAANTSFCPVFFHPSLVGRGSRARCRSRCPHE